MTSRVLAAHPARIAAVILEPETGRPPEPGYFAGLRELCDAHGVLLIPDETITGFRWHVRGARFVCGIEPDLSVIARDWPADTLSAWSFSPPAHKHARKPTSRLPHRP